MSIRERKGKRGPEGEHIASFTLPDSLPCSEVNFPILIKKRPKANWNEIVQESENLKKEVENHDKKVTEPDNFRSPFLNTECDYIKNEIFIHLLPALETLLDKARTWKVLTRKQRSFFNGIDFLAQELWNNNPRHPIRKYENKHLFNMAWVREHMETMPRPYYPKSWLWTEDYAATLIQKTVRQYFVQRMDEVQEMRQFWRKLKIEKRQPSLDKNPFLAKQFASSQSVKKPAQSALSF